MGKHSKKSALVQDETPTTPLQPVTDKIDVHKPCGVHHPVPKGSGCCCGAAWMWVSRMCTDGGHEGQTTDHPTTPIKTLQDDPDRWEIPDDPDSFLKPLLHGGTHAARRLTTHFKARGFLFLNRKPRNPQKAKHKELCDDHEYRFNYSD